MRDPKPSKLIDVANAILGLSYVEMTEMADILISSVKADEEDGATFDTGNQAAWCERLRWFATGYLDAQEDARVDQNR